LRLVELVGCRRRRGEDVAWRLAHEATVRRTVVVLVEPGEDPDVEVVQRAEVFAEDEALLAERAPEALHLAACGRVVRLCMYERGAEARAREAERLAAVRRAVVEVERVGCAESAKRT